MKTTLPLTLTAILLASAGIADAGIFGRRRAPEPPPPPPRHEDRHDHRDDRRDDRRDDYRGKDRLERRVQFRLRELGFYRGPVDGDFGRGSRAALARFQASRGLRPTGTLTPPTIRALRL